MYNIKYVSAKKWLISCSQYNKLNCLDFLYYSKITIDKTPEYIRFQTFTVLCNMYIYVCVCVCVWKADNIFSDIVLSFPYESTAVQILNNQAAREALSQGERRTVAADSFLSNARRVISCYIWKPTQHFSNYWFVLTCYVNLQKQYVLQIIMGGIAQLSDQPSRYYYYYYFFNLQYVSLLMCLLVPKWLDTPCTHLPIFVVAYIMHSISTSTLAPIAVTVMSKAYACSRYIPRIAVCNTADTSSMDFRLLCSSFVV